MSSSPFRAVIHSLDLEEPEWIAALFAEGRPLFDEGEGLFVYSYRVGTLPALRLEALAGEHTAPGVWQTLSGWGSKYAAVLAQTYLTGAGGVEASSDASRAPLRDLRTQFESHAIADVLTIVAHDPNGFGVFLTAPRPRKLRLEARHRRSLE